LLHIILSIGPLCRLDSRFLPLLYNRRHLGVTMFLLSHTVHHYALISVALKLQGIDPGEEFGIAPSTLRYLKSAAPLAG